MANVRVMSTYIGQAVAGEQYYEGQAIEIQASGIHYDLATAMKADNATKNVFVAIVPPDNFPRPTPLGMYLRPDVSGPTDLGSLSADTPGVGVSGVQPMSNLYVDYAYSMYENPVLYSGMAVQVHRGGVYTVPCSLFEGSPAQGDDLFVAANGNWDTTGTVKVGLVQSVSSTHVTIQLDN